jgi:hypothetical protein
VLPDQSGITYVLRRARLGRPLERWFSPFEAGQVGAPLRHRVAMAGILGLGNALGARLPRPEPVPLARAELVAEWMAGALRRCGRCLLRTNVSKAVRVAQAALERGLSLSGALFIGGGEPPTEAKVAAIARSGAGYAPVYASSEAGQLGLPCARPAAHDDMHLMEDGVALVQARRELPGGAAVDAFHFTSLDPGVPKVLLNVELDDYGIVERRDCGCVLQELGLARHLRQVRSFGKLKTEGATLPASAVEQVLERVLPARFGGGPLDYQFREREGADGLTRLELLAHPRLGPLDQAAVADAALASLRGQGLPGQLLEALLRQAGSVRVVREEPHWTARGKLLPLHRERVAASHFSKPAPGEPG